MNDIDLRKLRHLVEDLEHSSASDEDRALIQRAVDELTAVRRDEKRRKAIRRGTLSAAIGLVENAPDMDGRRGDDGWISRTELLVALRAMLEANA